MSELYKQSGVNLEEGNSFSEFAARVGRRTFGYPFFDAIAQTEGDHFRDLREIALEGFPKGTTLFPTADGIGTKPNIITEARAHRTAGYCLLSMIADDATRKGGLPLYCVNVLDVSTLGEKGSETNNLFRDLITGLGDAVRDADMALIGGETAELGVCVGSNNPDAVTKFNWAAFGINAMHPTKRITGGALQAGDVVIALREYGFGSNGMSFVRRVFTERFGQTWWSNSEATDSIIAAATPSVLYTRLLTHANGWHERDFKPLVPVKALAHITGGGIPEKFGQDVLFRRGLSAELFDLYDPPAIMKQCAQWAGASSHEIYKIVNGGQRMLAVVSREHENSFIALAEKHGREAKSCGRILQTMHAEPSLIIASKFDGTMVEYKKDD